jgi:hypothetical protein
MNTVENRKLTNLTVTSPLSSAVTRAVSVPMRAIVHRQYGTPDLLKWREIEQWRFQAAWREPAQR